MKNLKNSIKRKMRKRRRRTYKGGAVQKHYDLAQLILSKLFTDKKFTFVQINNFSSYLKDEIRDAVHMDIEKYNKDPITLTSLLKMHLASIGIDDIDIALNSYLTSPNPNTTNRNVVKTMEVKKYNEYYDLAAEILLRIIPLEKKTNNHIAISKNPDEINNFASYIKNPEPFREILLPRGDVSKKLITELENQGISPLNLTKYFKQKIKN
jgi:hypothetical protein